MTTAAPISRRARVSFWIAVVLAVSLFALAGSVVWAELRTPVKWDPLGEYPVQTILSRVPGVAGPAAQIDGPVDVLATKCNNTDHAVSVTTELAWKSVDPAGTAWSRGTSLDQREPGCQSLRFDNVIPPEVRALMQAQLDHGIEEPVWQIVGSETPVRDDGAEGVERRWSTQNFVIVP